MEGVFGSFKRLHGELGRANRDFSHNLGDFYRLATVFNLRRAASMLAA